MTTITRLTDDQGDQRPDWSESSGPAHNIASGVVPWPGSRGHTTRAPRAASASPSVRTSHGEPVKPCKRR